MRGSNSVVFESTLGSKQEVFESALKRLRVRTWFKVKIIGQDSFEILGSLHTVLKFRLHW